MTKNIYSFLINVIYFKEKITLISLNLKYNGQTFIHILLKRGGTDMNIIVHYPQSAEAMAELQKRVATVHIEAVTTHINSLSCPKSQKLSLLEEVKHCLPTGN